jgi:hypothetical protein
VSDIEIILIDDGSTDGSGAKCLEWARRDDRIIYARQKNAGQGPARNLAISMATAEFLAFCDSDDWHDKRYIELALEKQRETKADIVCSGWHLYDGELGEVVKTEIPLAGESQDMEWRWALSHALGTKLIRKSLIVDNEVKMPACIGQDTAIHFYLMTKANTVVAVERAFYYYYYNRPGSSVNVYKRHADDMVKRLASNWNFFIKDGIFEQYQNQLLASAGGMIKDWYGKVGDDKEYAQAWLSGCLAAIQEYFGAGANRHALKKRITGDCGFGDEDVAKELVGKRVVLFGAGGNGERMLEDLLRCNVKVAYFVDNNPRTESVGLYPVHPPEVLLDEERERGDLRIIITPQYSVHKQIKLQLCEMGLENLIL